MTRSVKFLTPLVTVAVVLGAEIAHAKLIGHYPVLQEPRFGWVVALTTLILLSTYAVGVTEVRITTGARLLRAAGAVGAAIVVLSLFQAAIGQALLPRFVLAVTLVLIPAQTLVSAVTERSRLHQDEQERVVALIGPAERERLASDMKGPLELPAVLKVAVPPKAALPTDADPTPLLSLMAAHSATLLVLDREAQGIEEIVAQAAVLHGRGVRIRTLSLFYDEWLGKLPISELERIALLFDINEIHRPLYARLKRFIDVVVASAGLVPLGIAMLFVTIANPFGNRGPLFYKQPRVGKDGETFTILKFRTMKPGGQSGEWTAAGDLRVT
ncbi:MAG: sugar transferase, partial [Acidimicrobiales bacterium]